MPRTLVSVRVTAVRTHPRPQARNRRERTATTHHRLDDDDSDERPLSRSRKIPPRDPDVLPAWQAAFTERKRITGIIGFLPAGKEAQVYICEAHPATGIDRLAAKVYRPRRDRAFKDESTYLEGRGSLTRGRARKGSVARAIRARSRAGRILLEHTWVDHEYEVLRRLYGAGVRVPKPVDAAEGAVLMEYLGDATEAAPRLSVYAPSGPLGSGPGARALLEECFGAVESLLSLDLIHGDLSPYNVLVHEGHAFLIDLPQAIEAHVHPDPFPLLRRDVLNLSRHFARYGLPDRGEVFAQDLWHRYTHGTL